MFDAAALPAGMNARHAATLAELAEIGMDIARELKTQVIEAETPELKARAVADFPKVARCVRQCLALEAKFARDARRTDAEDAREAAQDLSARIRRRKAQVRVWMERAICEDTPDDEDTVACRLEDLRDRLDDDLLDEDFADRPITEVIEALYADLGLDPPDLEDEEEDEALEAEPDAVPDVPPDTPPPPPPPPQWPGWNRPVDTGSGYNPPDP